MHPRLMGIVNVTPDSFSDGGLYLDPQRAVAHGAELAAQGAAILDVGGESTRPGAEAVDAELERERVQPVVAALAGPAGPGAEVSIDTSKAAGGRRRPRRRGDDRQRRHRPARRPRARGTLRRARLHAGADAHAGHAADDAVRPHLRRRRRRRARVPRRADPGRRRRRGRRAPDLGRPRDRVRQDALPQPRAPATPRRAARPRPPAGHRQLAEELHRRPSPAARSASASGERSPRTCSRSPPARRSFAFTTCSRSGARCGSRRCCSTVATGQSAVDNRTGAHNRIVQIDFIDPAYWVCSDTPRGGVPPCLGNYYRPIRGAPR